MSQLTIEQVAQVAWEAGFRGEDLVLAVAIAQGESGLRASAVGDESLVTGTWGPSIGLFQVRTLRDQEGTGGPRDIQQLADARFNARAAFEISNGGTDFTPWSVYNHDRYVPFIDDVRSVVRNLETRGAFQTGEIVVPGSDALDFGGGAPGDFASGRAMPEQFEDRSLETFLEAALAQQGDRYVMGFEVRADDPDPDTFDCSELVEWAAARAGVTITDGSWLQYQAVANAGTEMSVEEALRTPGALLFKFGSDPMTASRPDGAHVAISLGDGRVMEAKGSKYGTDIFNAEGHGWTHAGWIPGLGGSIAPQSMQFDDIPPTLDSDGDGLLDRLEMYIGTDPYATDTDRDGFADVDELLEFSSDPLDYLSNPLGAVASSSGYIPPLTNADELARPRTPTFIPSTFGRSAPAPVPVPPPAAEPPAAEEPAPPPAAEPPAAEPPPAEPPAADHQPQNHQPQNHQPQNHQPQNHQPQNHQPQNHQPQNHQPQNHHRQNHHRGNHPSWSWSTAPTCRPATRRPCPNSGNVSTTRSGLASASSTASTSPTSSIRRRPNTPPSQPATTGCPIRTTTCSRRSGSTSTNEPAIRSDPGESRTTLHGTDS